MKKESAIKEVLRLAVIIRAEFINSETVNRSMLRNMEELAFENEVFVSFDENGIPEQVEDDTL